MFTLQQRRSKLSKDATATLNILYTKVNSRPDKVSDVLSCVGVFGDMMI